VQAYSSLRRRVLSVDAGEVLPILKLRRSISLLQNVLLARARKDPSEIFILFCSLYSFIPLENINS